MEWSEAALALATRRHGETDTILEVMTRDHGRHLGLVRGGRSRRLRPLLQPGNSLQVTWRARLSEHLGHFVLEPIAERAAEIMTSKIAIYGIQLASAHLHLLPERDPHPRLFDAATVLVESLLDQQISAEMMIRFEILLLDELGFGLDLNTCAATGSAESLSFVSPKSGRAVSRDAGAPYADRLLDLPGFLIDRKPHDPPRGDGLAQGFALTGFFLEKHIYTPRDIPEPEARRGFIDAVLATKPIEAQNEQN